MNDDIDRVDFYEQLEFCKTNDDIIDLIDEIDNEDLHIAMLDKYNQILEFNKNETVKNIVKILEFSYFQFEKKNKNEN